MCVYSHRNEHMQLISFTRREEVECQGTSSLQMYRLSFWGTSMAQICKISLHKWERNCNQFEHNTAKSKVKYVPFHFKSDCMLIET